MDDDFEILDVENYRAEKDQQFSHQFLVMKVMQKTIESGCKEMRSGYWNNKTDKFGNILKVYIPDSRKEFIESVKTVERIMICDFDEEAITNVKKIKERLEEKYKSLCNLEKKYWEVAKPVLKRSMHLKGITCSSGTLNMYLPYYQEYLNFEVECYGKILEELTKLTGRKGFYEKKHYGVR